jgi:hypothetical protein
MSESQTISLPQLHGWQFQPDQDAPGLYLQCASAAQRDAIMRALGWYPRCAEYRSDTPDGLYSDVVTVAVQPRQEGTAT